jgi:glycosyltransferase involved in cell wall biosynthesis
LDERNVAALRPICHINIAPDYRGGERQTELLVRELARLGWQQRLVVRIGNPLAERCRDVTQLDVVQVAGNPVAAAVGARGSRLIHAHEARGVYAGWLASVMASIPYLMSRRVDNALRPSRIRNAAYARANSVVAISDAIAQEIWRHYPNLPCTVVHDAHSDLANNPNGVAAIGARYKGKTLIGHIGALEHGQKGQGTIIEAAKKCAESHPQWHFLLLGSGRDEDEFREAISGLANIELVGFVDNVGDYLANFDLFLFPSLHEGMGSILLDAMNYGLPIVASRVGGIPEIVEDRVNGFLIEPEQSDAMIATIDELLSDADVIDKMRNANQEKANSFSARRMAEAYDKIYRSILESP